MSELASGVMELLFDGPKTRGELAKLTRADPDELDRVLAQLERGGLAYSTAWRWFPSSRLIFSRAIRDIFSSPDFPENTEFGKFLKEFAGAVKLGATYQQAWELARRRMGR